MLSIDSTILKLLLENQDHCSGSFIAKQLGVSRVSIWGHLKKLTEQGFEFEAIRNRGYKIKTIPHNACPPLIEAYLAIKGVKVPTLRLLRTIDSTNSETSRLLSYNEPTPIVVSSQEQKKGRGRRGRPWHSESNDNIYLSIGWRPQCPHEKMTLFTLWMGVKICEWLCIRTQQDFKIKWPNDIVYHNQKTGGILTETISDSESIKDLILGVGLNINTTFFDKELTKKATSVAAITGMCYNLSNWIANLIESILSSYDSFMNAFEPQVCFDLFDKYNSLKDQKIIAQRFDNQIQGTALGIDEKGSLVIQTSSNIKITLDSGDVSLSSFYN